jgi:hypothetical protein
MLIALNDMLSKGSAVTGSPKLSKGSAVMIMMLSKGSAVTGSPIQGVRGDG